MNLEQRLRLAQLCKFSQEDSSYIFQPIESRVRISIAATEPTLSSTKQGNYKMIDCRNAPLPFDLEQQLDRLLLARVNKLKKQIDCDYIELVEILKDI